MESQNPGTRKFKKSQKRRLPKYPEDPSNKFLEIVNMRSTSIKNMNWEFCNFQLSEIEHLESSEFEHFQLSERKPDFVLRGMASNM